MPTLDEFAAMRVLPVLMVRVRSRAEQHHVVFNGATVGRAHGNSVVVDCCDVCAEHLKIVEHEPGRLSVECLHAMFSMTAAGGNDVRKMPLEAGAEFHVGDAGFRFEHVEVKIWVAPVGASAQPALPVFPEIRVACPRCQAMVVELPSAAKFCARCGLELPEFCPPWSNDGAVRLANPAVVAYAYALFNLGVRYENVPGGHDLAQAIRYFDKAAKIGVPAAKARLEMREAAH